MAVLLKKLAVNHSFSFLTVPVFVISMWPFFDFMLTSSSSFTFDAMVTASGSRILFPRKSRGPCISCSTCISFRIASFPPSLNVFVCL